MGKKIIVRLADEETPSEVMLFDTETGVFTNEEGGEPSIGARNLACTIGFHAWNGSGVCVNCGKKK